MAERALAPVADDLLPSPAKWNIMLQMATELVKSGLLPDGIKTPAAAIAVMQKGQELGVPPMAAMAGISIIKGKPACSAELMLALILRDHGRSAIRVKETTNESCTVEWREPGWSDGLRRYQWTIKDAERAELLKNDTWRKYPAAMLRARCISAVARMAFPESIGGMHTPEELGATVEVSASGDVVQVPAMPASVREITSIRPRTRDDELSQLLAAASERGWDMDAVRDLIANWFHLGSIGELGSGQVTRLLDFFRQPEEELIAARLQLYLASPSMSSGTAAKTEVIDNGTGEVIRPAASPQQLRAIRDLGERKGLSEQDLEVLASDLYDVDELEELGGGKGGTASQYIVHLTQADQNTLYARMTELVLNEHPEILEVEPATADPDQPTS